MFSLKCIDYIFRYCYLTRNIKDYPVYYYLRINLRDFIDVVTSLP